MAVLKYYDENTQSYKTFSLGAESVAMVNYNYSTDEQVVGSWIDGRPVYRGVHVPLQEEEYLFPNMTSKTEPSPYVVSSLTSSGGNYDDWRAFANSNTGYYFAFGALPSWIQIDIGQKKIYNKVYLQLFTRLNDKGRMPNQFTVEGSNDGNRFDVLYSCNDQSELTLYTGNSLPALIAPDIADLADWYDITLSTAKEYRYYRINVQNNVNSSRECDIVRIVYAYIPEKSKETVDILRSYEIGLITFDEYTKSSDARNSFTVDMLTTSDLSTEATDEELNEVFG